MKTTYLALTYFELLFILHMMKQIIGITNVLYRSLQQQDQDFSNAISLVSTMKSLIQELRDDG